MSVSNQEFVGRDARVRIEDCMGFWIRLAAFLIDLPLALALSFAVGLLMGLVVLLADLVGVSVGWLESLLLDDSLGVEFLLRIIGTLVMMAYHTVFIGTIGQTPGKMLLRIKVVDQYGNKPGWGAALGRETIGRLLSSFCWFLGHLWVAWDKEKRSWHDKIGGTYVVRKRSKSARS